VPVAVLLGVAHGVRVGGLPLGAPGFLEVELGLVGHSVAIVVGALTRLFGPQTLLLFHEVSPVELKKVHIYLLNLHASGPRL
jgi:hypothetical protein